MLILLTMHPFKRVSQCPSIGIWQTENLHKGEQYSKLADN